MKNYFIVENSRDSAYIQRIDANSDIEAERHAERQWCCMHPAIKKTTTEYYVCYTDSDDITDAVIIRQFK